MDTFKSTQELFESFSDTVLLVGNGKVLERRELIDSYDTVIRFNDFRIEGYSDNVGTKISAIGFASANLKLEQTKHLYPVYEKYLNVVPMFSLSNGTNEYKGDMLLLENDTRILSPEFHIRNNPEKTLTTGVATALNLALFFNKEVHLIGFDFMKTGHYWDEDHVHSEQHSGNMEFNIINSIRNIKIL
jgi:hypothetical protein